MKADKTITVVSNQNRDLYVTAMVDGAPPGEELWFAPIVAWKVTAEDNPDGSDNAMVYAEPLTIDPQCEYQPTIVDRSTWEWWGFHGESSKGKESLIEHPKTRP